MYALSPPSVHVFDRALDDADCTRRVECMLAALGLNLDSCQIVGDVDIPDLIRDNDWHRARIRQGAHAKHVDPALVFSTLRFDNQPDVTSVLEKCPEGTSRSLVANLLGYGGKGVARESFASRRGVCRTRVQFDTIYGCPHGCSYCAAGKVAVINTNLEEFLEREVIPVARQEPWQKVFMYNSCLSDTPCFEPEYGLSKLLADYYASTPDLYYLIHTKSANTDFLRDLDHQGHTIVLWSLTSATARELVEPGTALPEERIEAARRCQEAGCPIRFKLKPIVPVNGWREEYSAMIETMLAKTRPDSIGLFMLAWMDLAELKTCVDLSRLDPAFVDAVERSAACMKGVATGPFPHQARAEVYHFLFDEIRRHNPDVPVFLCTETVEMWEEFAPILGMNPSNYVCGCGPQCLPGTRKVEQMPRGIKSN